MQALPYQPGISARSSCDRRCYTLPSFTTWCQGAECFRCRCWMWWGRRSQDRVAPTNSLARALRLETSPQLGRVVRSGIIFPSPAEGPNFQVLEVGCYMRLGVHLVQPIGKLAIEYGYRMMPENYFHDSGPLSECQMTEPMPSSGSIEDLPTIVIRDDSIEIHVWFDYLRRGHRPLIAMRPHTMVTVRFIILLF
jgi:hypothetical protein